MSDLLDSAREQLPRACRVKQQQTSDKRVQSSLRLEDDRPERQQVGLATREGNLWEMSSILRVLRRDVVVGRRARTRDSVHVIHW